MAKVLRVNMSTKSISEEQCPQEWDMLGGRALTSLIVSKEVPPECDPLGPHNKLVFAPGILGGIPASSMGRISVGTKSPLTGGIKEANSGGTTGLALAKLGIKAMIVEGAAESGSWVLHISALGCSLAQAPELAGKGTYECSELLRQKYGSKMALIINGPAGEMLLRASGISHTDPEGRPSRYSARGGVGAVMGSKKLKAIIIDATRANPLAAVDKEAYTAAVRTYTRTLMENPAIQDGYRKYGTANLVDIVNALGALPTGNFSTGCFEGASKINAKTLRETILARGGEGKTEHACMPGCVILCGNVYPDENGRHLCAPVEFETIGLVGSNCRIDSLDDIARINYMCNDLGLDTIDFGAALGVAMEAGVIPFGDGKAAIGLLEEVRKGTPVGRLMGSGAALVGKVLGVTRIPAVKGQSLPAYDPRGIKGLGVTYASSPMGADHTAGQTIRAKLDPRSPEGQVAASRASQITAAMVDTLGLCMFAGVGIGGNWGLIAEIVSAFYGRKVTADDLLAIGKKTLAIEIGFNRRAGLTPADDRLPEHFRIETNPATQTVFDVPQEEIDEMIRSNQVTD